MHVKYSENFITSYDMIHWYVQDNGHRLTIQVNLMVKGLFIFMFDFGSNGYFLTKHHV
jgi:hypothetical protein